MSATTHQGQRSMPVRQLGAALAVLALALILAVAVALGQLTASKSQADPAAGAAPGQFDRGWSTDSSNVSLTPVAPGQFDRGWSTDSSNVRIDTAPKPGEFRLAPGNMQPTDSGDSSIERFERARHPAGVVKNGSNGSSGGNGSGASSRLIRPQ